jgi:hypothetical protein
MPSVHEKAEHVRQRIREGEARGHHCHWPGCPKKVPPAQWGCRQHWYKLPFGLRRKVWAAYKVGQEDTKTPSKKYVEVAFEIQEWIRSQPEFLLS